MFKSRAVGMFMGLAIGDALGAPVEFKQPGQFDPITEYRPCVHFNLPAGGWTDDTSMAWALAESLVANHGVFNERDIMGRWVCWMANGEYSHTGTCFDIGSQTRFALSNYNGHPLPPNRRALGNGCVMRMAPLAAVWSGTALRNAARRQCDLTHPSHRAREACVNYGIVLDELLRRGASDHLEDLASDFGVSRPRPHPPEGSNGMAEATLEVAVWAVMATDSFHDAVLAAVNRGDDADTVGAVTGAIAGAMYGVDAIPAHWLTGLAWNDRLRATADALAAITEG